MVTPELVRFIREQLAKGTARDAITQKLQSEKWSADDITSAFAQAAFNVAPTASRDLMPVGELFAKSWTLYKKRFLLLLGLSAIPVALTVLGSTFFAFASLVVGLVSIWTSTAMILVLSDEERGLSFGDALKKALPLWPAMFWLDLLLGFIVFGGMMLLFIPGFLVAIFVSFAQFFAVFEGKRGMNALLTSWAYVRGHWLSVFVRFLLIFVAIIALVIVIGLFALATRSAFAQSVAINLVGLLFGPFVLAFTFLQYRDLRSLGGELAPASSKAVLIIFGILGVLAVPILIVAGLFSLLSGLSGL